LDNICQITTKKATVLFLQKKIATKPALGLSPKEKRREEKGSKQD
jgi:hypothetical protein